MGPPGKDETFEGKRNQAKGKKQEHRAERDESYGRYDENAFRTQVTEPSCWKQGESGKNRYERPESGKRRRDGVQGDEKKQ